MAAQHIRPGTTAKKQRQARALTTWGNRLALLERMYGKNPSHPLCQRSIAHCKEQIANLNAKGVA